MKCSIVKGVPFACCFGVAGRMAHSTTCEEVAELIEAYCTCNESGDTCEHGHLARKCDVCELKAEIARLRSVCRRCSGVLMLQYDKMTLEQVQQLPWLSSAIVTVAQDMGACGDADAGKEPKE